MRQWWPKHPKNFKAGSSGAEAYLVRASSQAALDAVLTNALKELGASAAIEPQPSTDVSLDERKRRPINEAA